jgi:hypothetical protein
MLPKCDPHVFQQLVLSCVAGLRCASRSSAAYVRVQLPPSPLAASHLSQGAQSHEAVSVLMLTSLIPFIPDTLRDRNFPHVIENDQALECCKMVAI